MKTTTNEQTRDLVEARRQTLAALVAASGVHAEPADDSGGVRLFTSQDATGATHRAAFSLTDYGVDAVCGPFVHLTPRDQSGTASGCRLHRRGADGFPVGSDAVMREGYGKIPAPVGGKFQGGANHYGSEAPIAVHGWAWSDTFRRWGALVTFANGWRGFTWPATWGDVGQAEAQAILSETGAAGREGAEAKEVRAEG